MSAPHFHVVIAGTGFSGLGLAARLREQGVEDFVLLEKAGDVGGVWRDNRYPGCSCDVPSHLYSLSFAPNPAWTRAYSPQPELHAYLRGVAERFELLRHCRFAEELLEARWEEGAQQWRLRTSKGELTADFFVAAMGALSEPAIPELPGLRSFRGKVMHSARWDQEYSLLGKRVAVVGTGASAIQLVPAIQPQVSKLVLFQRTPAWILPRHDRAIPARTRRLFEAFPLAQTVWRAATYAIRELSVFGFLHPWLLRQVQRLALRYLQRTVSDPALRRLLTPAYTLGCKRILISDDYLPSLTQPNVQVVPHGVTALEERSVVAADGSVHEVDAVIFGTGFHVTDMPMARRVSGRGGVRLDAAWEGSPKALVGTTVSGFPNFFMLQGPNTGLGHSSVLTMIEAQIAHTLKAIRYVERRRLAAIEPTARAQAAFLREVDTRMRGTVWTQGGCASWYLDATGRNSTLWPGFISSFRRRAERFDPADYLSIPRTARKPDAELLHA